MKNYQADLILQPGEDIWPSKCRLVYLASEVDALLLEKEREIERAEYSAKFYGDRAWKLDLELQELQAKFDDNVLEHMKYVRLSVEAIEELRGQRPGRPACPKTGT